MLALRQRHAANGVLYIQTTAPRGRMGSGYAGRIPPEWLCSLARGLAHSPPRFASEGKGGNASSPPSPRARCESLAGFLRCCRCRHGAACPISASLTPYRAAAHAHRGQPRCHRCSIASTSPRCRTYTPGRSWPHPCCHGGAYVRQHVERSAKQQQPYHHVDHVDPSHIAPPGAIASTDNGAHQSVVY